MNCKSNINNDSNDQDSKIGDNTDINDDLEINYFSDNTSILIFIINHHKINS